MSKEEREIDNCLIMRIKKLKEQVKNLIQQVIGSCILAFTKNKKEKRITELEKENAELREKYLQATDEGTSFAHLKSLERENAKLKKELKDANEKVVHLACNQNKDLKYKLTKATELLKKWVELYKPKLEGYPITPIQEQTEQFLKGENIILEDAQVGNSPFDADEVFNKEMKAYPKEK